MYLRNENNIEESIRNSDNYALIKEIYVGRLSKSRIKYT